jgi:hypothetical protein
LPVSFVNENPNQISPSGELESEDVGAGDDPCIAEAFTANTAENHTVSPEGIGGAEARRSPTLNRRSYLSFQASIGNTTRETSVSQGLGGFIDADDIDASPTSLHDSALERLSTPRRASFYTSTSNANLIDPHRAKLLHYFKIWVGQPWVSSPYYCAEIQALSRPKLILISLT